MLYPIPLREPFGKDHLAYWENFLTQEDIALILAQPEWLALKSGTIGGGGSEVVNNSIRASSLAWMSPKPETIHIWNKLALAVSEVNRRYFQFDLTGFHEPIQLGVYYEADGGHYDWHIDSFTESNIAPRKLSMALLLSDNSEFEGGEFQVKTANDEAQTLETKQGRAWFFPSYVLHRVAPVTKGVRRSLVVWVGGPPFK